MKFVLLSIGISNNEAPALIICHRNTVVVVVTEKYTLMAGLEI